jgi:Transposase IS4
MGVFSSSYVTRDYWRNNPLWPDHPIREYMSQTRFKQILRYFHIANPSEATDKWIYKVNPLLNVVRSASSKYYVPQINVSINEAMIRFSGRSRDTFKMLNKPINEGYKAIYVIDRGYIVNFRMPSRTHSTPEVEDINGLN